MSLNWLPLGDTPTTGQPGSPGNLWDPAGRAADDTLLRAYLHGAINYTRRATRKHIWQLAVDAFTPVDVTWSPGRIASLLTPINGTIYVGGDLGLSSTNGLTLVTNAVLAFGPEEGVSRTVLLASSGVVSVTLVELIAE